MQVHYYIPVFDAYTHLKLVSDLYKMDFKTDMTEQEYLRDANYRIIRKLLLMFLQSRRRSIPPM